MTTIEQNSSDYDGKEEYDDQGILCRYTEEDGWVPVEEKITTVERMIINNAHFLILIDAYLKKECKTRVEFEDYCKSKDVCVTFISDIKTPPYRFNPSGKKLVNLFLDPALPQSARHIEKNGKKIYPNIPKYQIQNWG
jgi:hypothetical protein